LDVNLLVLKEVKHIQTKNGIVFGTQNDQMALNGNQIECCVRRERLLMPVLL